MYKTNRTYYAETYLKDHLGNIRAVFGNDGSGYGLMQTNTYYPFGMEILTLTENSTSPNNKNEYKYNGKMLQDELGLNWLDYGARFYDGVIGRWHSVDPLAENYVSYSPFNYTLNNPILLIDSDGRKVEFAPGVSEEYKKAFAEAVQYLNRNKASGMLARLEKSEQTYYIAEASLNANYDPNTRTINWDSDMGILTNEGVLISATTVLNHEVDHALQHDTNPEKLQEDSKKGSDKQYETKEERRVITGSEQRTAKKLGEIKEGEVTRKDHKGSPIQTQGPTSTTAKNEVEIISSRKAQEE